MDSRSAVSTTITRTRIHHRRPLRPGAARGGGEGRQLRGEVMTVDQGMLEQKMEDFCIRVLSGDGTLQETAVLPHILEILLKVKKSRQD